MKTRTTIEPLSSPHNVHFGDTLIALGSCFAADVGALLAQHRFDCIVNPYGIVYNPASLNLQLCSVIEGQLPNSAHYVERDGVTAHLDYHSHISGANVEEFNSCLKRATDLFLEKLKSTKTILLTLGTAYVYEYSKSGEIVTNCHKLPSQEFRRRLLTIQECKKHIQQIFESVQEINPNAHFICTVSPIRHTRDSLIGNTRSKAHLLSALHDSIAQHSKSEYFPSYEIMIDDLRDYRYYKDDFIHPTPKALNYIWNIFLETYTDDKTRDDLKHIEKANRQARHRPIHSHSN